ncbi:membrane protein [Marinicella pacifica]|jgi:drug/metabolite transporter (DMT)-like permease|uniref:Membrane protein n=1 Tax=Marinicella pacifica TaxID=1171543 RepID=A0A917CVR3_9GAMM|nr:DMT family transporter [Marinicella pacifica]GGG00693.1 membrane protein [Marinicella pacifica]
MFPQGTTQGLLRAIGLMLLAALAFSVMNVLIRAASVQLHAFEIAFFRNVFGLLFMLPWFFKHGLNVIRTDRLPLFMVRAVLGIVSMFCFFWGLTVLPLAKAVALGFTVPLFVTVGAAVVLKEAVHARRWAAVIVGFIGTLIILRPSLDGDLIPSLVVVFSALTMAASVLIIKDLSRTENPNTIVIFMVLLMTPLSLPVALTVWQWPDAWGWLLLVLLGFSGSLAHLLFTHAIRGSEVSLVMPFDFARLPFVIVLAWLFFNERVDRWTLIGAVVVFASGAYIAHRESQLQKRRARLIKTTD